ncbi:uncharacterized protein BDZ83DRAFT_629090 [Colletotrichum acutatum]|uniref:Uncharacterized protein n=1 Tax=Glomerella acutata TaxID=27357 RepID=A0AAD8UL36_GLOAC|nr:uncharacterized protein BDZ83DRAFT_629090 [Colletotrichum acutatum]KAK1722470.1 hypothetical protein BDZ83DRAFT_629090 [Colletotrichum acutatum]
MVWVSSERGLARSARGEWPKEKSKLTEIKRPAAGPDLRFLCSPRLLASFPCRLPSSAGLASLSCICFFFASASASGKPTLALTPLGLAAVACITLNFMSTGSSASQRTLVLWNSISQAFNLMRGGQRDILEAHTDAGARPLGLSKHVASLLQKPEGKLKKQTSSMRATVESRQEASDSFPPCTANWVGLADRRSRQQWP